MNNIYVIPVIKLVPSQVPKSHDIKIQVTVFVLKDVRLVRQRYKSLKNSLSALMLVNR